MTEYDYSPAAYEKYLRTQTRVSNWVSQTKAHERQYANPFVASVIGSPAAFSAHLPPEPKRSKSSGSTSTAPTPRHVRPSREGGGPQRSKTLDSKQTRSSHPTTERPSRSRSFSASKEDVYIKPRSRSHHSHSRSQPQAVYTTQAQYHYPHPPVPAPVRSYTAPHQQFVSGNGQPIYLPQAHPGQTFVIIPPGADRRVEYQYVSAGTGAHPTSPPRTPGGQPRHAGAKEPFLKRLWGGLTRSGGHSRSGSGDSRRSRRNED
ncbi:hypothetical protein HWV62_5957 [Athelia sp. TMB]|nr:hypothetical protein HWV62_5957 [Athelia sp. TMB]